MWFLSIVNIACIYVGMLENSSKWSHVGKVQCGLSIGLRLGSLVYTVNYDSAVNRGTDYRLDDQSWIPGKDREFSLLETTISLVGWVHVSLSSWIKKPNCLNYVEFTSVSYICLCAICLFTRSNLLCCILYSVFSRVCIHNLIN